LRWPPLAKPGEVNHDCVDRFTLVHASIGVVYGLGGLGLTSVCVLAVGWELVENPLKAWCPRVFPSATRDTLRNAVCDTLAVFAGWSAVQYLS